MSAVLESEAIFEERVTAMGLADFLEGFKRLGWGTHGTFAYSSSYVPGAVDDSKFVQDVVIPLLERDDHPKKSLVRRLFFESYTVATAELRRRHDRTEEDAPRRVPASEKEARRSQLAARLAPGVELKGELDPSYSLIDAAVQMHEDNTLIYLDWEVCTKREMELTATKKDKTWKPDAAGVVKEKVVDRAPLADTSTDLKLRFTLQRRGLALDIADLLAYEEHQKIVDWLLGEYHRIAPDGYNRVSLEQVHHADREIFRCLQEVCRGGIKRRVDGKRPLEDNLEKVLADLKPFRARSGAQRISAAEQLVGRIGRISQIIPAASGIWSGRGGFRTRSVMFRQKEIIRPTRHY